MRQSLKYFLLLGSCLVLSPSLSATTTLFETESEVLTTAAKIAPVRKTLAADLVKFSKFEAASGTEYDNAIMSAVTLSPTNRSFVSVDSSFNARVTASIAGAMRTFALALGAPDITAATDLTLVEETRNGVGSPASPFKFKIAIAKGTGAGTLTRTSLITFLNRVITDTYTTVAGGVSMVTSATATNLATPFSARGQFLDAADAPVAGVLGAQAGSLVFTARKSDATIQTFTASFENAHAWNVPSNDTGVVPLKFNSSDTGKFISFDMRPSKLAPTADPVSGVVTQMSAMPKVISQSKMAYIASLADQRAEFANIAGGSSSVSFKDNMIAKAKFAIETDGFTAADVAATSKADSNKIFVVKVGTGDVTSVTYTADAEKLLITGTTAPEEAKTYTLNLSNVTTFNTATGALLAQAPDGDTILVRVLDATGYVATDADLDAADLDVKLVAMIKKVLATTGNITTIQAMTLDQIMVAAQS
ncbi:MAG: hypothetical protein K2X53_03490 [Alphaproteobacteria bacterium]|nr:hypothetical protein [Alphaproteobacteria bacterium]